MPIHHYTGVSLRYPFSGEGLNSIPSPVKNIQDLQSTQIPVLTLDCENEEDGPVIAEYATNQGAAIHAYEIVDDS